MIAEHATHRVGFIPFLILEQAHATCHANQNHENEKTSKNCKIYAKRLDKQLILQNNLSNMLKPIASVEIPHKFKQINSTFEKVFKVKAATNEVCSAENKLPANADQLLNSFKSNIVALATLKRADAGFRSEESKDLDVNAAFENTGITKEFYQEIHKLDLNQMLGGPLLSLVRFGAKEDDPKGLANAFWNGFMMVYGCGGKIFRCLSQAMDVAVHEVSHAVTEMVAGSKISQDGSPTGLNYEGDAGGLNEANSDQAASAALQWFRWKNANATLDTLKANKASSKEIKKQQAIVDNLANPTITEDNRWKIAYGIIRSNKNACLRDMANPGTAYVNDSILGTDIQAGFETYNSEKYASADPHQTSAVGNKWFYELSCNLYNSLGVPVWSIAENIRFEILPYCHPNIKYPEYAELSIIAAKSMDLQRIKKGQDSKNPHVIEDAVREAWNKVGIQV